MWMPVFGNRKLKDITTTDISEFLTGLVFKPATAKKNKNSISQHIEVCGETKIYS